MGLKVDIPGMNQDIVDYISAAQKHGLTDFEIKQNLLSAGWEAPLVEQSFSFAKAAEGRSEPGKGAEMLPQQRPQQGVFPNAKPEDFNQPSNSGPKPFQPSKNLSSAVATPMMSDQNFSPQGSQAKKFNVKILAFALVILFVLASGAYGYYAYVYTPPAQNIWGQFLTTKKNPVFKTQFTVAYNDSSAGAASSTQTVSFSFGANAAVDASDPANIKSGGQLTVGANEGIVNFNVQFGYMLLSKVFYLDASNLPEIKNLLPDPSKPWLKIDQDELSNYAKQNLQSLSALSSTTPPQDNKQLNDKLIAIWSKANLVTSADPAAKEKINGTPVYHLTNSINSSALKSAVSDSVDAIENAGGFPAQPDDSIKQALLGLIDKMQVKDFQTWIGQKDHELYKIQMAISMPSVADMSSPTLGDSLPAIGTAKAKSRDAKRLADVRQLASALELYYNDYSGYPAGAGGVPVGGISPNYIGLVPTAPTPSDGSCTDYYNGYWYEPSGKPSSYNGQTVYPSYS